MERIPELPINWLQEHVTPLFEQIEKSLDNVDTNVYGVDGDKPSCAQHLILLNKDESGKGIQVTATAGDDHVLLYHTNHFTPSRSFDSTLEVRHPIYLWNFDKVFPGLIRTYLGDKAYQVLSLPEEPVHRYTISR